MLNPVTHGEVRNVKIFLFGAKVSNTMTIYSSCNYQKIFYCNVENIAPFRHKPVLKKCVQEIRMIDGLG